MATGRIESVLNGVLRGWAWDASRKDERLNLVLLADGRNIGPCRADRQRSDLQRNGIGDGGHGLEFILPLALQDGAEHTFSLLIAGDAPPHDFARNRLRVERRSHMLQGKLERIAGTKVVGWVADRARADAGVRVEVLVDGAVVATVLANAFRSDLVKAGIGSGKHGFSFDLAMLRPQPNAGAMITIRTQVEEGYWPVGTIPMPSMAKPAAARQSVTIQGLAAEAREAERRRDFAQAAALLDRGLAEAKQDFELLALRARVAMSMNEIDLAERYAREALAITPGHVRPIVILARVATSRAAYSEAVDLWAAVQPGDDNYRERLVKRGRSLMALGRPLEALSEFSEAAARDGSDRDALRGAAEAAQTVGGVRSATRYWKRYAELMPDDATAAERLANLAQRLVQPDALSSPLRNPTLREWTAPVEGTAFGVPVEPSPWLRLRSLSGNGTLRYAVAEPRELRAGLLPCYGLWLRAEGGGAEIAFALDPKARADLMGGLCMALEVTAPEAPLPVAVTLAVDGSGARQLLRVDASVRPKMARFDLLLDQKEASWLDHGRLWLVVRSAAPGVLRMHAPRVLGRSRAMAEPVEAAFENPALASTLAGLGIPVKNRDAAAEARS